MNKVYCNDCKSEMTELKRHDNGETIDIEYICDACDAIKTIEYTLIEKGE